MDFQQAKEHKKLLDEKCTKYSNELNEIAKKYPSEFGMGLINEEGRNSKEYRLALKQFDETFAELRTFNKWYSKTFKKEVALERKNRVKKITI